MARFMANVDRACRRVMQARATRRCDFARGNASVPRVDVMIVAIDLLNVKREGLAHSVRVALALKLLHGGIAKDAENKGLR
jgi:hypothetical protein